MVARYSLPSAISTAMASELDKKPFGYAQSHQNDPLGAAVLQGVIREIESKGLIRKAQHDGSRFLSQLGVLVDNDLVLGVRCRELMFAVDPVNRDVTRDINLASK
jgi:acetylornithine aminotransferase